MLYIFVFYIYRYFLVNFDAPKTTLEPLKDHIKRDLDILRGGVIRKHILTEKPCDNHDCDFGELTDEMVRRNSFWQRELITKL